jgi:hypothetical protein
VKGKLSKKREFVREFGDGSFGVLGVLGTQYAIGHFFLLVSVVKILPSGVV